MTGACWRATATARPPPSPYLGLLLRRAPDPLRSPNLTLHTWTPRRARPGRVGRRILKDWSGGGGKFIRKAEPRPSPAQQSQARPGSAELRGSAADKNPGELSLWRRWRLCHWNRVRTPRRPMRPYLSPSPGARFSCGRQEVSTHSTRMPEAGGKGWGWGIVARMCYAVLRKRRGRRERGGPLRTLLLVRQRAAHLRPT